MISMKQEVYNYYAPKIPLMSPSEIIQLITEHSFVQDHKLLDCLTPEQKNNRELFEQLVKIDVASIYYANDTLKNDDEMIKKVLSFNGYMIIPGYFAWNNMINPRFHTSKEFIILAVKSSVGVYSRLDRQFKLDKDIVLAAIHSGLLYNALPPHKSIKLDKDIAKAAIDYNPSSIKTFMAVMKADAEVVHYAFKKDPTILQFVSDSLRNKNNDGTYQPAGELLTLLEKDYLNHISNTLDIKERTTFKQKL